MAAALFVVFSLLPAGLTSVRAEETGSRVHESVGPLHPAETDKLDRHAEGFHYGETGLRPGSPAVLL